MKRFGFLFLLLGFVVGCTPQHSAPEGGNPVVIMQTSMGGPIKIELFEKEAPITVKNFLGYVDSGFYDGTVFHRVIPSFMIQGGGFEPGMREKPTGPPIKNESTNNIPNKRGTLAMARTDKPDSATAQFYINVADNTSLDRASAQDGVGYCVFGKVIDGMDVVDNIKAVRTGKKGQFKDVPVQDVLITTIKRVQ